MQIHMRLSRLALSYWASGDSLRAWTLTSIVVVGAIIIVLLHMLLNKWQAGFYNHLMDYNFNGFLDSLLQFIGFSAVLVFISAYQSYYRMLLEMRWRHWLTEKYVAMWLHKQTYYQLNLTRLPINPEQRISEDIKLFITNSLDLSVGLLRHFVTLVVFSMVLWQMSGLITLTAAEYTFTIQGYLLWLALLYSALGTCLTMQVGKSLAFQNVIQQTSEAEFRSALGRITEYDECVAFYGGERTEQLHLTKHFHKIIKNYLSITHCTKKVNLVSFAYSQMSIVFAFLVASPRYFNNEIQLGQLFEISGAYWFVHSALSYIIDSFGKFAFWKAVAHRLQHFSSQMYKARQITTRQGSITNSAANQLRLTNVTVFSLHSHPLVNDLSLTVKQQDRLLISGPSGCGKTTLLRTIAGMWPYFTGTISKPQQAIFFLPQKPYIAPTSLRNALLYPHAPSTCSDEYLREILGSCNLSQLSGKLDQYEDWGKNLSLGQQQCLSIARAILNCPDWLFLDEATSNIDAHMERRLYRLLEHYLPKLTIISVGHRDSLIDYHTLNLTLSPSGKWSASNSHTYSFS
ncbi:MAG: transporter protein [Anaerospora sp.]|nr:transporter protein [Anaerospora sp.]